MNSLLALGPLGVPELIVIAILFIGFPVAVILIAFAISRLIKMNKTSTPLPPPPLPTTKNSDA